MQPNWRRFQTRRRCRLAEEEQLLASISQPDQRRRFWRWTAGIGWFLDILLLGWAIFIRSRGYVSSGLKNVGVGSESLTVSLNSRLDSRVDDLMQRDYEVRRFFTQDNEVLDGAFGAMASRLTVLRTRLNELLRGAPADKRKNEGEELSQLITELQSNVDKDREILKSRDKKLLAELQDKAIILRSLSERLKEEREEASKATVEVAPMPRVFNTVELTAFAQGAALPVILALAGTLAVTALSQQFVRVATAFKQQRLSEAEKMRKVLIRRFRQLEEEGACILQDMARGEFSRVGDDARKFFSSVGGWAAEPTWEELLRAEAAAFWEQWSPQAFRLEAMPQAPQADKDMAMVAAQWWNSVQVVVKGYFSEALVDWGKKQNPEEAIGLVIRIYGRWPQQGWVNIANLPLAGDWREKALRFLIPAKKDVKDLPLLGPLCEAALTAVVSSQVSRVISTSVWGSLTTDLWGSDRPGPEIHGRGERAPFQIGYEVVEVQSCRPEEMAEMARALPNSGTDAGVRRVVPAVETRIKEMAPPSRDGM